MLDGIAEEGICREGAELFHVIDADIFGCRGRKYVRAVDKVHQDVFGIGRISVKDSRDLDKIEFDEILFCLSEVGDLLGEAALINDVADIYDKRAENTNIDVFRVEISGPFVGGEDRGAAFFELLYNVAATEFDDDGAAGCIRTLEDEGDHAAVDDTSIDLDVVFGLYLVEEFVVDFVFSVAGVGRVFLELGSEIGIYLHGV